MKEKYIVRFYRFLPFSLWQVPQDIEFEFEL